MTNALEIQGLRKAWPGFLLEGLDLVLPSGCIMGLIGANGAGKSTVIRLILGMLRRDAGSVRVLGRACEDGVRPPLQEVGVVLGEAGLPGCLNAVQAGRVMQGVFSQWDKAAYARLLRRLAVPTDKPYGQMSYGMRMKLSIAVAMAHHARLLVLDEPTNGLDPLARDEMMEMLGEFTRVEDNAVLISSHIVSDLERVCDYVAFLHQGRLLLCAAKDELLADYGLAQGSAQQLRALDEGAVLYRREGPWGAQALVRRSALPQGVAAGPVSLEELFVMMVKGESEP